MQVVLRRRAAHNGLELSCPAARATVAPFSRNWAGKSRSNFPHASRVSCSELLGGLVLHDAYLVALNTNERPSSYKGDSVSTCTWVKPASSRSLANSSFQYHRMTRSSVTHETRCLSL